MSSSSADDQNEVEVPLAAPTLATMESHRAAPVDVLRDFQQYQTRRQPHAAASDNATHLCSHPLDGRAAMVPGIAGQYAMRHGVQYYRDLAGNVKQVIVVTF